MNGDDRPRGRTGPITPVCDCRRNGQRDADSVDFHGEDFDRGQPIRGNKTTVFDRSGEARIAIFEGASTRPPAGTIFPGAP